MTELGIPPRAGRFGARMLVIDGDPLALSGICRVLEDAGEVVIARATSSREGIELARVNSPDMAFIAGGMPEVDGVAVIEELTALGLGIRPLLLTDPDADADVGVAAIRAGARGCVTRTQLTSDAPHVLHVLTTDQIVCSRATESEIMERLLRAAPLAAGRPPVGSSPTARERDRALDDVR